MSNYQPTYDSEGNVEITPSEYSTPYSVLPPAYPTYCWNTHSQNTVSEDEKVRSATAIVVAMEQTIRENIGATPLSESTRHQIYITACGYLKSVFELPKSSSGEK